MKPSWLSIVFSGVVCSGFLACNRPRIVFLGSFECVVYVRVWRGTDRGRAMTNTGKTITRVTMGAHIHQHTERADPSRDGWKNGSSENHMMLVEKLRSMTLIHRVCASSLLSLSLLRSSVYLVCVCVLHCRDCSERRNYHPLAVCFSRMAKVQQ